MNKELLKNQILDYLQSGGLFNPELMNHKKVSELLLATLEVLTKDSQHESV